MKVQVRRIPGRKKPAPNAAEQAKAAQEQNERVWKEQLQYKDRFDLVEIPVAIMEDFIAHSTHVDENGDKKILAPLAFIWLWWWSL